jgi:hypothetical protein
MGSRRSFPIADVHVLRVLKQTGQPDLPSHQVRDDEDEFAQVERFRQVSLIAGDKGALLSSARANAVRANAGILPLRDSSARNFRIS